VYRCNICSLVVHQLLLAGVLGLKQAPIQAALVVPLFVATLAYATLFYKSVPPLMPEVN
jgi:ABC-type xylose transport system permease subunit